MKLCSLLLVALCCPAVALGQSASDLKVSVQLDKLGWYWEDGDPNSFGTVVSPLAPLPAGTTKPMMRNAIIADVESINGRPARGAYVSHGIALRTANIDFPRNHFHYFVLAIQTPDGQQVGEVFGTFLSAGTAAPGAPAGGGNWTVYGGNGPFVGLRGQGTNVGGSNYHITTMKEDTAVRRTNSSGRLRLDFYLSGVTPPEIQAAYHSADWKPVNVSNPAQPGEVVVLEVRAAWPTRQPLEPGETFPLEQLRQVAIPVEATLNGEPAEVLNAVGWPGTRGSYRVDVRLPSARGPEGTLNVATGYILQSVPFKVPIR